MKSEAADEKDFNFAIVVLRDGTHIVKEEDDRSESRRCIAWNKGSEVGRLMKLQYFESDSGPIWN